MALTINPVVSRTRNEFLSSSALFFLGATIGSLIASLIVVVAYAYLIRLIGPAVLLALVALVIVLAILRDFGVRVRLPYRSAQVPEWLRDVLPPPVVAFCFGVLLGTGVLTLFTYSAHLGMLLTIPLLSSGSQIILAALLFAAGKTLVIVGTLGIESLDRVSQRFVWTPTRLRVLRITSALVCLSLLLALVNPT